ncbi:hypothetical protein LJC56_09855 [Christensenellaceae bacterium OttesenSCG-928-K19]|nr:hypothetical protein [Christensenellaceae bacterium OttesenSCG-928-K19]
MKRDVGEQEAMRCRLLACDFGASSKSQIKEKIIQVLRDNSMSSAATQNIDDAPERASESTNKNNKVTDTKENQPQAGYARHSL